MRRVGLHARAECARLGERLDEVRVIGEYLQLDGQYVRVPFTAAQKYL